MNKVAVYGGLGNQMFQFAFFNSLKSNGKKTQLSFLCYFYYKHHSGFDLARAFKIKLPAHQKLMVWFLENCSWLYYNKPAHAVLRRLISWYEKQHKQYSEKKEFFFDKDVYNYTDVFFKGTWQSEEYFQSIAKNLKAQFVFKKPADSVNKQLLKKIASCNAVSLHVRRGDYLLQQGQQHFNVIKDETYYTNAVAYIKQHVNNPHFFVFSDDISWVKQNVQLDNCTYVDANSGKKSYIDMCLMANCKHNIIANSTFSWWAAWLNNNNNKIVIMPNAWLSNAECKGLYLQPWIKMNV